jgi:hypothetical protein
VAGVDEGPGCWGWPVVVEGVGGGVIGEKLIESAS